MANIDDALKQIDTFLSAFYHEENDLRGTAHALDTIRQNSQYRRDLAYAFKLLLEIEIQPGILRRLVRDAANRNVYTDEEARSYLWFLFHDTLLNYEIDFEDES